MDLLEWKEGAFIKLDSRSPKDVLNIEDADTRKSVITSTEKRQV